MKSIKKYSKFILAAFLLFVAIISSGCGASGPVQIQDISLYDANYGNEKSNTMLYLSWKNEAKGMTADSLELVIKGSFGGESEGQESIRYRISLPEGIAPGEESSSVYEVPGLLTKGKYKISVSRVSFTDGTVWNSGKNPSAKSASVDGRKGKGMPASLEEMNYYEQRADSFYRDMNVLWINKGDKPLRGVVYEVLAYDAEGNRTSGYNAEPENVYIPVYEEVSVMPGEAQDTYHISLNSKYYLFKESRYIELRIVKAIAEDGTVYTAAGDTLKAYFGSKKAYNFGNEKNSAVKKLGNKVTAALKKYGIKKSKPLIYVREGDFAILRYDDIDIRVELTKKGKLSPYMVSFVTFYTRGAFIDQIEEGVSVRDMNVAKAILPCVLTKMKKKEILEKVDEFYHNDRSYIDFSDHSYDTFDDFSTIFSEDGVILICEVLGVGVDFDYYPLNSMFWAYDSIYESERSMTVPKRP
jgi:hypothetical protein